jgi:hypothetical protein
VKKGKFAAATDEETKKLEKDINSAQGSNLINAQNSFTLNNTKSGVGGQVQTLATEQQLIQYDKAAAEAQWAKLQQAQELGIAQVQPIHVNLPTRGLRHAFTQVLQTEVNKPMTIHLQAVNDKTVNWPKRVGAGAAAFLGLWVLAAFVANRFPRKPTQAMAPA